MLVARAKFAPARLRNEAIEIAGVGGTGWVPSDEALSAASWTRVKAGGQSGCALLSSHIHAIQFCVLGG